MLGSLQQNERVLKPCLVHDDLWDGNIVTNFVIDEPVVFDASCLYAHNEYELYVASLSPWLNIQKLT